MTTAKARESNRKMGDARLAAHIQIDALRRLAEGQGGFAAVVKKGDSTAGQIIVILLEKGDNPRLFERQMMADFSYQWAEITLSTTDDAFTAAQETTQYLARAKTRDPDLWIIELDVAETTPLIAALGSLG